MRCFVNVLSRVVLILLASSYTLLTACHGNYEPMTQPSAVSPNQEFMLSEIKRFTPMLNMGEFIGTFADPPAKTYAGWSDCVPGGRAPWYVHFNRDYVEGLDPVEKRPYMSALVAHEMCHHWVTKQHGSCYDEVGAELCAYNLVTNGRPQ
jgi:hypothetical protein